jgi:hypothetical protein
MTKAKQLQVMVHRLARQAAWLDSGNNMQTWPKGLVENEK